MRIFFAITVLTLCAKTLFAQCSDAGVCVIGAKHKSSGHYAGASYVFGKSAKEDDLTFHTLQIEIGISVFKSSKIGVVFPWSRVSGPLGNTSGAGDLTVLWNQDILGMPGKQLNFQIGGKLATGNANSGSLPQAYQPGLGTNDLLLGISYETEPWLFSLGYQLSKGRSENTVTRLRRGDVIGHSNSATDGHLKIRHFQRTNRSCILPSQRRENHGQPPENGQSANYSRTAEAQVVVSSNSTGHRH